MTQQDLEASAHAAGLAGEDWSHWTCRDEVQDAAGTPPGLDTDALEAAWVAGLRERRLAAGWRIVWTTAPEDYDWTGMGTETVERCGEWHGKPLRRVIMDPHHASSQIDRYGSGLHPAWDEDPRVEAARAAERRQELDRLQAERAARREAGLAWIATASDEELDDYDTVEAHGLDSKDSRAERERRAKDLAEEYTRREWKRCLEMIPEGATLIDDGEPSQRGQWGVIPGREAHVWYNVRIERGWPDEADRANVMGEGRDNAGSALLVADWIGSGRLRVAKPGEVPPHPVAKRIGLDRWRQIRRVEVDGREAWVGRALFASEALVLDAKGRIVRSKAIQQAALAAWNETGG